MSDATATPSRESLLAADSILTELDSNLLKNDTVRARVAGIIHKWLDDAATSATSEIRGRVKQTLTTLYGQPRACRGCGVEIWFGTSQTNSKVPIDASGANHFMSCPHHQRFRKSRVAQRRAEQNRRSET